MDQVQHRRVGTRARTVLICGSGVAGPTLAYWLAEAGSEPTLLEHALGLRTGGYMLDFWGLGFDVAEKVRLLAGIRDRGCLIDHLRFGSASGSLVWSSRHRASVANSAIDS